MKYVYVMQSAAGLVKIGVSKNVQHRRKHLENQSGIGIKVISIFGPFNAAAKLERIAHELFSTARVSGEWFNISVKDACDAISEVASKFEDSNPCQKNDLRGEISAAERHLLCMDEPELIINTVTYLRDNMMIEESERLHDLFMARSLTTRDYLHECQLLVVEQRFYDLLAIHNELKSKIEMHPPCFEA